MCVSVACVETWRERGWEDGSVLKDVEYFFKRTGVQFPVPISGGSKPPVTPALWGSDTLGLSRHYTHVFIHTHTHTHTCM